MAVEFLALRRYATEHRTNKDEIILSALPMVDTADNPLVVLTSTFHKIFGFFQETWDRPEELDRESENIHALQRSELLDPTTCSYCLSVDGRIIERDDPFGKNTIFHSNCRGIWVAILKDEDELPAIGGIPRTIRDRFGDEVNDLMQPKKPITKKGTPARDEADKRNSA